MHRCRRFSLATAIAFATCLVAAAPDLAAATGSSSSPKFDSVAWVPLGCPNSKLITHSSPSSADFAGSTASNDQPASYAYDSTFLYFRFRLDGNPGSGPFAEYVWTVLMQVPSGDHFTYQYQLSLNGNGDTIEIWKNDPATAQPIDFSPLFHDDAETKVYSTPYKSGSGYHTVKLARSVSDGSSDYFLDFAFPISKLIAAGAIASSSDLASALFFPATSTNPNTLDKSYLNCPFQPYTILDVTKSVQPATATTNVETPVAYTIGVTNKKGHASGVSISDVALPSFLSNVSVGVATNDGGATYTIVSTNPLVVKLPKLSGGKTATVTIAAKAKPGCNTPDFTNTATVGAANASEKSASALLDVQKASATETCDGLDNDCDGSLDEGSLCDDGNACTADSCKSKNGCAHTPIPGCTPCATPSDCGDDANACTTNICTGGVCGTTTTPGCTPCTTSTDCGDDGNACTTNTCTDGACGATTTPGCTPCTTPTDCGDDGNACTTNTCTDGACGATTTPGCTPCTTPTDCGDDGNACTTNTCTNGACGVDLTPNCEPCTTAADCTDDHDACTDATCANGFCGIDTTPGCESCNQPSDCTDDGNACTTNTCTDGVCGVDLTPDCEPCTTPTDCTDDHDACTDATCANGFCGIDTTPGCEPCNQPSDCTDDGNACTVPTCEGSVCGAFTITDCAPCQIAADCDDQNPCTTEMCLEGTCSNVGVEGCAPCETDADCNDQQACTSDACGPDGSCRITTIDGCVPCETSAECNDNDGCTTDACTEGACTHQSIEGCEPEICTDGVDNDGDGDIDCADSDCANDPACRTETCGNCLDDDGDGLVDYEDEDCCDNTSSLVLRKMSVRTKPAVGKNGLRLNAQYAPRALEGFDPGLQGTTLQLRDAEGDLFCQKIPFKSDSRWVQMGVFKFRDKTGQMAAGLRKARFKIKKKQNNRVVFRTRGKNMSFRDIVGKDVAVTIAVGNQCTTQTASLRTKKGVKNGTALVYKRPKGK